MAVTVEAVMRCCNNYFEFASKEGEFTVASGRLTDETVLSCSYIAISGSLYNDGVWSVAEAMTGRAETFTGKVWMLRPPKSFIDLVAKCGEYEAKVPVTAPAQESFGEYSYTRAAGSQTAVAKWQEAFRAELSRYWKPFTEVSI